MQSQNQTSKEYFNSLTIIHAALIAGQLMFIGVLVYLNRSESPTSYSENHNDIFLILAPVLAILGILGGFFITKNRLESIDKRTELKDKLEHYRTTLIIKFALLEGPSLFSLVCFLLSGNYMFLGLSAILILILFTYRPTKEKTMRDLELSHKDRLLIEDPEAIVAEVKTKS